MICLGEDNVIASKCLISGRHTRSLFSGYVPKIRSRKYPRRLLVDGNFS